MKKEYWIIETDTPGELLDSKAALGPYSSVAQAESWLRDDAKETFLAADKSCRDVAMRGEWAAPVHIVQVVKTVKQCPEVSVRVRLQKC